MLNKSRSSRAALAAVVVAVMAVSAVSANAATSRGGRKAAGSSARHQISDGYQSLRLATSNLMQKFWEGLVDQPFVPVPRVITK